MAALPERSSSSWRRWFPGKGRSATGRGKLKGQEWRGVQNSAVGPSAVSAGPKDATQTSNTAIDVSQPATGGEPISFPLQAPAATSTSSSPLPAARASISGDVATSADAHRSASPPERL